MEPLKRITQEGKTLLFKKFVFLLYSIVMIQPFHAQPAFKLDTLPGTHIYSRMFYFYFPVASKYNFYFNQTSDLLQIETLIHQFYLKSEPLTPSIFETDVNIRIQDIPLQKSGKFTLPVTIRCNKKVSFKNVTFSIYRQKNILILRGVMSDLLVSDISDNEYFRKRFKWKYPLYFDLRYSVVQ